MAPEASDVLGVQDPCARRSEGPPGLSRPRVPRGTEAVTRLRKGSVPRATRRPHLPSGLLPRGLARLEGDLALPGLWQRLSKPLLVENLHFPGLPSPASLPSPLSA